MSKALVVYYSWSNGNTERIAKQLQQALDADIAKVETVQPYVGSYEEVVDNAQDEVRKGVRPEIKPLAVDPKNYDIIAIGTPTWWYTVAPAMATFLSQHDWHGKKVIPFMTNGGWPGHVIENIKKACAGAIFLPSMEIKFDAAGGAMMETPEEDVEKWIKAVTH